MPKVDHEGVESNKITSASENRKCLSPPPTLGATVVTVGPSWVSKRNRNEEKPHEKNITRKGGGTEEEKDE